jgi:hypothetical protein
MVLFEKRMQIVRRGKIAVEGGVPEYALRDFSKKL